jgi:hypothetical protein
MTDNSMIIGRVTRSSTRGFVGAIKAPEPEIPVLGTFCKAPAQQGRSEVVGVIYNISIEDDELTRQLAASQHTTQEELADQQFVRQIPIEFEALAIGYKSQDTFHYALPPQPPLALATIQPLEQTEIETFTRKFDFIPIILSAANLPVDELLAASLRIAARTRQQSERRNFLLEAGRFYAKLLSVDLGRMDSFLRNIGIPVDEKSSP